MCCGWSSSLAGAVQQHKPSEVVSFVMDPCPPHPCIVLTQQLDTMCHSIDNHQPHAAWLMLGLMCVCAIEPE